MDLKVAVSIFIFSITLSLIGQTAGIGEIERDIGVTDIIDDVEMPSFEESFQDDTGFFEGVANLFNETFSLFADVLTIFRLMIPPLTGVAWFDLIVWGGISFSILLGSVHILRGGS